MSSTHTHGEANGKRNKKMGKLELDLHLLRVETSFGGNGRKDFEGAKVLPLLEISLEDTFDHLFFGQRRKFRHSIRTENRLQWRAVDVNLILFALGIGVLN